MHIIRLNEKSFATVLIRSVGTSSIIYLIMSLSTPFNLNNQFLAALGFILAELKIHLLSEFSDAELSRLVIWLKEISNTITKDKGHTTDVYSLKLIK